MKATIIRGDARHLPLADSSVDLLVTSPPYWALRSYQDGGEHYAGQIGAEPTPAAYIDSLIECTREWMRVLKPSGSIFVNLGDSYATRYSSVRGGGRAGLNGDDASRGRSGQNRTGIPEKSLRGLPWRYALACVDDLGLILRAEIIWSKPNGLPESVTDRVRRSHETWFHFTKSPRYYAAVDTIREPHSKPPPRESWAPAREAREAASTVRPRGGLFSTINALGKLPGSVWSDQRVSDGPNLIRSILEAVAAGAITTDEGERLWTGQSISCATSPSPTRGAGSGPATESRPGTGRSPSSGLAARISLTESATGCSSGPSLTASPSTTSAETPAASGPTTSRPSPSEKTSDEPTLSAPPAATGTALMTPTSTSPPQASGTRSAGPASSPGSDAGESVWLIATQPLKVPAHLDIDHFAAYPFEFPRRIILGWSPPGGTILDPFGGTGTTALVAEALGRHGVSVDMSADYCRLAAWRTTDPGERAKALGVAKPAAEIDGQQDLLAALEGVA